MSTVHWRVWAGIAAGVAVATACASPAPSSAAAAQEVNEAPRSALGAVVALEGGCTAAKVGPKHLLVAARCVTNKPGIAIGKTLRFHRGDLTIDASDAAAPTSDASDAADSATSGDASSADDAGVATTADAAAPGAIEGTIAQVQIHPSYLQKCGNGACAIGKAGGADVADVAIIVLADEIADLPIAPIELDLVSAGTRVLAVGNGCGPAAVAAPLLRAQETVIADAETAAHTGSPYTPDAARTLAASYVTTRGPGDGEARSTLGICSDRDLGAPLFLANGSAIVGVSSNTTPSSDALLPMTNQHARVDAAARHGVGGWLAQMGAKTSRACSDSDAGCKPLETSSDDAGASSDAATTPDARAAQPLSPNDGTNDPGDESPSTTSSTPGARPQPTASSDGGGCSAAPHGHAPETSFGILALATAALLRRRRKP